MADKKILKLIEQALKQGETSLSLSFNKLTSLPPEITKLTNLTSLYLSENKLPIPETEQWGQVLEFKDKLPKTGCGGLIKAWNTSGWKATWFFFAPTSEFVARPI